MKLQALFLHDRLALNLFEPDSQESLTEEINRKASPFGVEMARAHVLEKALAKAMDDGEIPELGVLIATGKELSGQLVMLSQRFYFKRHSPDQVRMHAPLSTDKEVGLSALLSTHRSVGVTGRESLSGSRAFTVMARAREAETNEPGRLIELAVIFIGLVYESDTDYKLGMPWDDRREVYPPLIDQFGLPHAKRRRPTKAELNAVATLPEKAVKERFAEIIGESYVDGDWGGEKSDLYSARLTMDGSPVSAAFAFKGPGVKGKLTISKMGKNGDQGLRIFREPADIAVIQYYGSVDAEVRNLLSALARMHHKRFMIIDGVTTAEILAANGRL